MGVTTIDETSAGITGTGTSGAPNSERTIRITGGAALRGAVTIGGAKNAALPALAATLLTGDECVLNNVPDLADIATMVDLLRALGAEVQYDRARKRIRVRAAEITRLDAPPELVAKMRASFLVAGPLLARFGEMAATTPGGCRLGARPVDVDVRGFRQMGAKIEFDGEGRAMRARTVGLRGARVYMDYPSHTGTENLLMAATLASGRTTIVHAACEPEIVHLGNMLNRMGARIGGLGSPILTVEGVDRLHGVAETILPDRLEAGTFAIGAVITGGEVTLHNVREPDMLPLTAKLREAGTEVWVDDDRMLVRPGPDGLRAVEIQTLPFPGFPTDLQPMALAVAAVADGHSMITENVFEARFMFVNELVRLGADVRVDGHHVVVRGRDRLSSAPVVAHDIRAGAGLVLAGLVADGRTEVAGGHHILRGYPDLAGQLSGLGAEVSLDSG